METLNTLPNPAEVLDNPIRWLPISVSGSLAKAYRDVIDPTYGFDTVCVGYRIKQPIETEAKHEAVRILQAALEPGPPREILRHLRMLREIVVGGSSDPNLQFAVYATQLQSVPAAALELAVGDWARKSKFWPTLFELHELVEARLQPTRLLLEALR